MMDAHVRPYSTLRVMFLPLALACSGDTTGPGGPGPGQPVTATIEPDGGVTRLELPGGSELSLEVPAGAVTRPLAITLTPQSPASGSLATVSISPGGVLLLKPIVLRFTLGESVDVSDPLHTAIAFGSEAEPGTLVLATSSDGRVFTASTPILGAVAADDPAGSAIRLDDEAQIDLFIATVEARIAALNRAMDRLTATNRFEEAVSVQLAAATLAQLIGADDAAQAALETAADVACQGLTRRHNLAEFGLDADFAPLWGILRPLLSWHATVQAVGVNDAACPAVGALDAQMSDLVVQYVELYTAAMQRDAFAQRASELEGELYSSLVARKYGVLLAMQREFGLVKEQIQLPLARRFREASYSWCRTDYDHKYLGRLFRAARDGVFPGPENLVRMDLDISGVEDLGVGVEEFFGDLQMCGTDVVARHRAEDGTLSAAEQSGGPPLPGPSYRTNPIGVSAGGQLELEGLAIALRCATDLDEDGVIGDDRLFIDVNGVQFAEVQRPGPVANFLNGAPLILQVDELIQASGADPATGPTITVALRREGSFCGGNLTASGITSVGIAHFALQYHVGDGSVVVATTNPEIDISSLAGDRCEKAYETPTAAELTVHESRTCTSLPTSSGATASSSGSVDLEVGVSGDQLRSVNVLLGSESRVSAHEPGAATTDSDSQAGVELDFIILSGSYRYRLTGSMVASASPSIPAAASSVGLAGLTRLGTTYVFVRVSDNSETGPPTAVLDSEGTLTEGRYRFTVFLATGADEPRLSGSATAQATLTLTPE